MYRHLSKFSTIIMIPHLTEDACKLIATKDYRKIDPYFRKELAEKMTIEAIILDADLI